ncbi:MAG TPA: hypothetical protein VGI70_01320 [Polyangiales bacterium]
MINIATDSDYLVVKLHVGDPQTFEKALPNVLPIFEEQFGWRFLLSSKKKLNDSETRYFHIWQTANPIRLANIMLKLGRSSEYQRLHESVSFEQQDIFRLAEYSSDPQAIAPARAILAETLLVTNPDAFTIEDWKSGMAVAAHSPRKDGLSLQYGLQSQTGTLRRFVNIWSAAAPDSDLQARQRDWLGQQRFRTSRGDGEELTYDKVLKVDAYDEYQTR